MPAFIQPFFSWQDAIAFLNAIRRNQLHYDSQVFTKGINHEYNRNKLVVMACNDAAPDF